MAVVMYLAASNGFSGGLRKHRLLAEFCHFRHWHGDGT
jgi:hypothetical protein